MLSGAKPENATLPVVGTALTELTLEALTTSACGTFETCRLYRAMSAFERNPDDICSLRVLPSLTRFGHSRRSRIDLTSTIGYHRNCPASSAVHAHGARRGWRKERWIYSDFFEADGMEPPPSGMLMLSDTVRSALSQDRRAMKKFEAIEGLRGWLAWAVVFSHLAYFSNLKWKALHAAGFAAVLVFIIISGFVITHLIIQRPEPYGLYLLRRFMRIFPLFAVTCAIGYFTNDLQANLLSLTSDVSDPQLAAVLADVARSNHDFFWQHFVAHITLLHGAISDTLLPFSQYAFNIPGWSVSLEWQFYLLAPILIGIAQRPRAMIWLAAVIFIAETGCRMFGSFVQPSLLAAVAGYFAVGVASRLFYPSVAGAVRYPSAMLAVVIVLFPLLDNWGRPLLIWTIAFVGVARDPSVSEVSFFARLYTLALESPIAIYFGSRSFSTYLCHMPVIAVCYWFWLVLFFAAPGFIALSATVIPITMITSELLYRGVERPGIALGTRLALGYQAIARKRRSASRDRRATALFGSTLL